MLTTSVCHVLLRRPLAPRTACVLLPLECSRHFARCQQRLRAPIRGGQPGNRRDSHQDGKSNDSKQNRLSPILVGLTLAGCLGIAVASFGRDLYPQQLANPPKFAEYTLVAKYYLSPTCAIFALKPPPSPWQKRLDTSLLYDPQWLTSVEFKQPQLNIARSYTLLPRAADQHPDELRFLIRKEHKGEVSGYLHDLNIGAKVEIRGPKQDCRLPDGDHEVLFLAGGTGIAPALQLADKVRGRAKVHIFWASRTRPDCYGEGTPAGRAPSHSGTRPYVHTANDSDQRSLVFARNESSTGPLMRLVQDVMDRRTAEENALITNRSLDVELFIDEEGTFITPEKVRRVTHTSNPGRHQRLIFVSGPAGFIAHWAGPKKWFADSEEQGVLGGKLAKLLSSSSEWQVIKL